MRALRGALSGASALLAGACVALALACGGGGSSSGGGPTPPPPPPPPPPVVAVGPVSPATPTLMVNSTTTFSATVSGTTNTALTWTATGGAFAGDVWTAPSAPGTATVTATSVADPSKSASTTVTVTAAPVPAPVITSFTAGALPFTTNQGTTLTAAFTGGTGVVTPGNLAITGDGVTGLPVTPAMATRTQYVLTVTNAAGVSVSANLTVYPANAVVVGYSHTLTLKSDGTVWAWGGNGSGRLGDGTMTDRVTPVQVMLNTTPPATPLSGIVALAAGGAHSLALKADGTVYAWGWNGDGQLGDGTMTRRATPVQVMLNTTPATPLSGIVALAAGDSHSLALKSDGTVYAWGYNGNGELGDGTGLLANSDRPVAVSGLTGVVALAAGGDHSLALKGDGTVYAWGYNGDGELGDGTGLLANSDRPVAVSGLTGVVALAAGYDHSLALKSGGTVSAWGYNGDGELGDGTGSDSDRPVAVSGLTGVVALAAGEYHSLALKSGGTVSAWGYNGDGQLGDGTTTDRLAPVPVIGLTGIVALAVGSDANHSLALKPDGAIWAWGYNADGELGDGMMITRTAPVQVVSTPTGLTGATALAAGQIHSLALKSDHTVWAWGYNSNGQLGDGTTTDRLAPVAVDMTGLMAATALAAGNWHSLALKTDGTVWAWGDNGYGQLGDNSTTVHLTPTAVDMTGLTAATALAAGLYHSLALKTDGTVWAWGYNNYGQLGDNSITEKHAPVAVDQTTGLTGATALAAGEYHSLALKSDNTVWAWGQGANGRLGDGTTANHSTPVQVLTGVTALAAGSWHSLALKTDGTVWAWGYNSNGQLGDGTTTDRLAPVQVLTGVTALAAGQSHSLALKNDGTVWAWGYNGDGELGDGTTTDRHAPVQVASGLTGAVALLKGGSYHSLALKADGTVWAWGDDSMGQLGQGRILLRTTAAAVPAFNLW